MTYDDTVRYQMMLGDLHQKLPWSYKRLCRVVTLAERSGLVTKERVAGARHGIKRVSITELGHDALGHGGARKVPAVTSSVTAKANE